jgi:glycosyltransferase involved in cell wall biosynthesis
MRSTDLPPSRERDLRSRLRAALPAATGMLPEPEMNGCQADPIVRRPTVCVVGSFPARAAGGLPTQGEELAIHLQEVCRCVEVVSRHPRRSVRLLHVAAHLLLYAGRYDAVCLQVYGRKALLLEAIALLLGRAWGCRVVLHLHAGGLPAGLDRRPEPSRWLYGLADAAVCPSEYLQQEMARHGLRLRVIPNAIDPARYPFRARQRIQPRLLWLRTFHPFYNPMLALRTFELVRWRYPDARLTMAGMDRGFAHEIQQAAAAMALPVDFPGLIPRAAIPVLMDAHDIYLNTPRLDNTPVTVIEALLCGLPVVATNVGGVPHLLRHEETGLLVGDDDAENTAAAVVRLVEDPALGQRLSVNGRRLAESFSWRNTLPLWAEVLAPASARARATARGEYDGLS